MTLYCVTHNWLYVQKMLNHGLNHGFLISLFNLIFCPIHWIVCVLAYSYLNFRAALMQPKTAASAQTLKSMSFIWTVWSTLYVYLWSESRYFFCIFVYLLFHTVDVHWSRLIQEQCGLRYLNLILCIERAIDTD